jgi:hypothetical protein
MVTFGTYTSFKRLSAHIRATTRLELTDFMAQFCSLGSNDLFDAPKGPPPAKPSLAAALKAKQKSEEEAAAKSSGVDPTSGNHSEDMNQPQIDYDEERDSLGSNDLFEAPKGPPPAKPLLAAALKAKQKSEEEVGATLSGVDPTSGNHWEDMNQPQTQYEDEGDSLGSNDLFEAPKGPPPAKPLLAAALKAKQKSEEEVRATSSGADPISGDHLKDTNQPQTQYEDEGGSFGLYDLLDAPKGPPPAKTLLAAALKAGQKSKEACKAEAIGTRPAESSSLSESDASSDSEEGILKRSLEMEKSDGSLGYSASPS